MKQNYQTPQVEVIEFEIENTILLASPGSNKPKNYKDGGAA